MKRVFLAAMIVAVSTSAALAASIDVGQALAGGLVELINGVITALIAALVGWVLWIIKSKFNIDIEARHREALTAFLQRQASALVSRGAVRLEGIRVEVKNEELAAAANAALKAIPDALRFFGLTPDRVAKMIVDLVPKEPSVAQAQAVAIDVVNPATPSAR